MAVVTGGCTPSISFTQLGPLGTDPAYPIPEVLSFRGTFANGSGANQVALIHAKTYPLAASTPQTPDLQSLVDIGGNPISLAAVTFLAYRVQSTSFPVTIGGAGANEWNGWLASGSKLTAFPSTTTNDGYTIVQAPTAAGMPVTSTSRLLQLDPGANAVGNFDLIIVGR